MSETQEIGIYDIRLDADRLPKLIKEREILFAGADEDDIRIDTPAKAAAVLEAVYDASNLAQEKAWLLALNEDNTIKGAFTVSVGTMNSTLIHPGEVMLRAMKIGAVDTPYG